MNAEDFANHIQQAFAADAVMSAKTE
jgi:hypothetical protein